ncbi:DNA binding protein [Pseudomonas chlororaphis]|nr:DNA binding protein [Pseudomonas chlororaphis]
MSLIQKYNETKSFIAKLEAEIAVMEKDGALKKEMEFESKLRTLLGEYNKALPDVINILDPQSKAGKAVRGAVKTTGTKRARKVKQYKNPHNGEVIETKGGNHKTLKEWKAKWGGDVVEGWATLLG